MSVVITTYTLASGLMQQGMTWWQAMLTILLGNVDRAGADDPERARRHEVRRLVSRCCAARASASGARTCRPSCARSSPAAGSASRRGSAALALNTLLVAAWPGWADVPGSVWIAFARLLARSQVWIIVDGPRGHQAARGLVGAAAARRRRAAAWLGGRAAAAASGTSSPSRRGCRRRTTPFWQLFPAALTANVGYWATLSLNIPDFTRYARSQRSQALGQALGLPTTMTAFAFIGVAVTSATIVMFGEADLGSGRAHRAHRQRAGHHLRRAGRHAARS